MSNSNTEANWKAPAEDGRILLWPDVPTLLKQTLANSDALRRAEKTSIQNVPLAELRRKTREWLGYHDVERPLIATGHQVELHHPGVWVKNIAINEAARRLQGEALHLAVDTDAPKHLNLRWPGGGEPISDDPALTTADWSGLVEAPTPAHLDYVREQLQLAARQWNFRPLAPELLIAMRGFTLEAENLPSTLINAEHQLDWKLGLRHRVLLASGIWASPGYLALAYHVLARGEFFAHQYNATLAVYRRENRIDDLGRPWPDLRIEPGRIEAPFWCDDLSNGRRTRASVELHSGKTSLRTRDDVLEFSPTLTGEAAAKQLGRFLSRHGLRLSPRAITLTVFMRLLVADQFVHGIGGGIYDQITSRFIERFFNIAPPWLSVTTATLLFPCSSDEQRVDIPQLLREGRRLRHQWADPQKRELARQIEQSPRHSPERGMLFSQMHRKLTQAMRNDAYRDWQERLSAAREREIEQREIFSRELFYAIQPAARLQMLIERYHELFA